MVGAAHAYHRKSRPIVGTGIPAMDARVAAWQTLPVPPFSWVTVDWNAVPGDPLSYAPDSVEPSLRALAFARTTDDAARARVVLANFGIIHDHSSALFPAAAFAAPNLLSIVEHGQPAAADVAVDLLTCSLHTYPFHGNQRVDTPYAQAVPICCAVADHVRARRQLLAGQYLLKAADTHWRFEIDQVAADGRDTIARGHLSGIFPAGAQRVELHTGAELIVVTGRLDGSDLRLVDIAPSEVSTGAVVFAAACGEKEH